MRRLSSVPGGGDGDTFEPFDREEEEERDKDQVHSVLSVSTATRLDAGGPV